MLPRLDRLFALVDMGLAARRLRATYADRTIDTPAGDAALYQVDACDYQLREIDARGVIGRPTIEAPKLVQDPFVGTPEGRLVLALILYGADCLALDLAMDAPTETRVDHEQLIALHHSRAITRSLAMAAQRDWDVFNTPALNRRATDAPATH